MSNQGYCPVCGCEVFKRERSPDGVAVCINGHTFPLRDVIHDLEDSILPIVRLRLEKLLQITDEETIVKLLAERREDAEKWRYVPSFGREKKPGNGKFK